jgi:8-oxo-dGTP pyrophosphatase MutT (NUDIX family)
MEELIFQYFDIRAKVEAPTQALIEGRDGAHILLKDGMNRWVLSRKRHYVDGLWRMVGGGIEVGEDPLQAMRRELHEELGVEIDEGKLIPLVHVEVNAEADGKEYTFSEFVFYAAVSQPLHIADELEQLGRFSDAELNQVIGHFDRLPDTPINADNRDGTWLDYGKIWGPIHRAAFERVKELGL